MGHLQQAGHDSLADADGEMPAPADVPLRGRAGPEQRAGLEHGRPEPAGHRRRDCLYRMKFIGRMMSVTDGTEADGGAEPHPATQLATSTAVASRWITPARAA